MKHREVEPLLLSVREAANAIRLSEHELRAWVAQGVVPSVRWRPGSHPLIPLAALHELIARHSGAGTAVPSSTPDLDPAAEIEAGEGTGLPERNATRSRAATRDRSTTSGSRRTVPAGHAGSKDGL